VRDSVFAMFHMRRNGWGRAFINQYMVRVRVRVRRWERSGEVGKIVLVTGS